MNARMPWAMSVEFKRCLYIRRETFAHWLLVRMTAYVRETRQEPIAAMMLDTAGFSGHVPSHPQEAAPLPERRDGLYAALEHLQESPSRTSTRQGEC